MTRHVLIIAASLAFSVLAAGFAAPASATHPKGLSSLCGARGEITDALGKLYAEHAVGMGLATNGGVIEVFASPAGSWTILLTKPDGEACVLSAGESWETLPTIPVKNSIRYF
ncbi:MAG: hypothetical protein OQK07_05600 [Rhodospirillales bacterium]|nr:hypothetical protein [Rhodospirillales bacterium]